MLLIEAGADVDARTTGRNAADAGETPLHWAASNDDVDVARVLIDCGADIEAPDGSIGTPLENAIGYACLGVARLLVERGAKVEKLWTTGALGMLERLRDLIDAGTFGPEDVSQGFWHACAAGQRRAAEFLLGQGADLELGPRLRARNAARCRTRWWHPTGERNELAPRPRGGVVRFDVSAVASTSSSPCLQCAGIATRTR